ncbi:hypothetical protein SU69_07735 [Thermosipho melanesiensis]|uniref:YkgJ family cysteine cluster protein n=2 Tax=Thermosipho melanesiensis TaxID=46541 RepID=A6LN67_THEM4|nr:hypothetical protein [Thermosipho melanesiensis]ABR31368.1 hypothetical protein Tmel_1523 [Thermosipho melanesiensis BI429]APT74428.1 hypothetical protein BW47_08090 [Thermosipho melanesiensis]OOC36390.1 hypothetical protein SU68_07805 [Thermosipho melanesiensis]OOC37208.1 hypothetical protein SU69_07735 [Thermosipho melanesiensis]OOC37960.1 hypothetical protein SU70_07745 [Thermosipho melanesiensis]
MYVNIELCKKCQGKCCKNYPGIALPKDFGNTKEEIFKNLIKAFKSGKWSIDWDKNEEYFVRPSIKGRKFYIFDHAISGECVFLTEKGCKLSLEKRPSGCLLLEPRESEKCIQHLTKRNTINEWKKFKEILLNAAIEVDKFEVEL